MAEATATTSKKAKAEVTMVKMQDGREVPFAGKRRLLKETLIDESKITKDADGIYISNGAIKVRMDFRDGTTRTFDLASVMIPRFAGHGGEQKFGDELASPADKPLSYEDMVLAVEELHNQVNVGGSWRAESEGGGGFSGASVVIKALVEASGKTVEEVKAFLQKKLDDAKAKDQKLSRNELYASFRNPKTKVGQIIQRLEEERLSKEKKVDADAALAELGAS